MAMDRVWPRTQQRQQRTFQIKISPEPVFVGRPRIRSVERGCSFRRPPHPLIDFFTMTGEKKGRNTSTRIILFSVITTAFLTCFIRTCAQWRTSKGESAPTHFLGNFRPVALYISGFRAGYINKKLRVVQNKICTALRVRLLFIIFFPHTLKILHLPVMENCMNVMEKKFRPCGTCVMRYFLNIYYFVILFNFNSSIFSYQLL